MVSRVRCSVGIMGDASDMIGSYKPSKGLYSYLCAEHRRELVIWGSFVDYVPGVWHSNTMYSRG